MEKHKLSKSTFIRGLQCTKSLYLYKNFINLRDTLSQEKKALFNRGNSVGVLAQQIFPNGIDATPHKSYDYLQAVSLTHSLIASGVEVIYEAAFQANGVLAILDILVKKEGKWYGYEVKSSAKISNTYILDGSLQYYVITNAGIELEDFSIVNINTKYIRRGGVNVHELFKITSIKKEVSEKQKFIEKKTEELFSVSSSDLMPDIKIGEQCFFPYSCDFMGQCWKNVPKKSVFEVAGISKLEQFNLYNSGIKLISEIPKQNELNEHANLQLESLKTNTVIVNKEVIKQFFDRLVYPLKFIDFETFMPAIPLYNETHPYENIPFQFSCHELSESGHINHVEFLAESGIDPRKEFLLNILKVTLGEGSILVYDALMEKGVLNNLIEKFPEYKNEIQQRIIRIVDLMKPFQEKAYYHPLFKGSFSIKNVLPAIDPELNYYDLPISSGSIAMIAFEKLQTETDIFKIAETRDALLEYCKMDTLAMVKIFEALKKAHQ